MRTNNKDHIVLTSHPHKVFKESPTINWGEKDPRKRGPVIGSMTDVAKRNAIGTHGGQYTVYGALSRAAGHLSSEHVPDLTNTAPVIDIAPNDSWFNPEKMVTVDPWGAKVAEVFSEELKQGFDIRPSIAITKAHIKMPELTEAVLKGRLKVDGKVIKESTDVVVTKAAIEPVWYLPGMAKRIGIDEGDLRRSLFKDTGGMFPELVTRPDIKVLLPPIGGLTAYIFGDVKNISDLSKKLTCRVHDECNGSDVFGSDICTCRPYLVHGLEESIKTAQDGGNGLVIYFRKEGRALGEVTKFLVYNARKRQEGGDSAANYFRRTECVAGVEDMRFQEFMPDSLHWLGVKRIDNLISMSDMKYDSIVGSGIEVTNRVTIPADLIPEDAQVEMEAKKAAGYYTAGEVKDDKALKKVQGRGIDE
ncbi:MAG: GTP cyclohydrolase II [Bacteriovoracaceae bacterium]|jgi:GTP cyclohydrolase II|nr:GTP cyclohydrolase II [Bacteriovoracaceae bacterium]